MKIYPKDSLRPSNCFNLWRPFDMELYNKPYIPKDNEYALNFILNHIKILCNNDEIVYQYLINWIAQMIQFPEIKTVVITLISQEGAGKGTLMKLFAKMLGNKKILETSTPSRDVFGSFNSLMSDCFLVNLNELSKTEVKGNEGQFKQMVTDGKLTINSKGVSQYQINSYHRFFITTNNLDPITTKKDDRRNVIIRSSDEKINDKKYFIEINDYLDNDAIVKTVYEYFKTIKNMDTFGSIPLPVIEYHSNLKESNRGVIDQWLEEYTYGYKNVDSIVKTATESYNDFSTWKEECDIKIFEMNKLKFGTNLKTAGGEYITCVKVKYGNSKMFNILQLKIIYDIKE
jgi:phage/plasmid-associated DNA primase